MKKKVILFSSVCVISVLIGFFFLYDSDSTEKKESVDVVETEVQADAVDAESSNDIDDNSVDIITDEELSKKDFNAIVDYMKKGDGKDLSVAEKKDILARWEKLANFELGENATLSLSGDPALEDYQRRVSEEVSRYSAESESDTEYDPEKVVVGAYHCLKEDGTVHYVQFTREGHYIFCIYSDKTCRTITYKESAIYKMYPETKKILFNRTYYDFARSGEHIVLNGETWYFLPGIIVEE